jgi:hypothetical protein
MKGVLLTLLGLSLFGVMAEASTVTGQIIWTSSCLVVMSTSALLLNHIEKKEGKNERC